MSLQDEELDREMDQIAARTDLNEEEKLYLIAEAIANHRGCDRDLIHAMMNVVIANESEET